MTRRLVFGFASLGLVALVAPACSSSPGGGGGGAGGTGKCSVINSFVTKGTLGNVTYVMTPSGDYNYTAVDVYLADFSLTCGGANDPPSYSAQNFNHTLGFDISGGNGYLTPPVTVSYPGPNAGPLFLQCGMGIEEGGGYPQPLCTGAGSYNCLNGSTVTVTSISPTGASGSYSLTLNDENGANIMMAGNFSFSTLCPGT